MVEQIEEYADLSHLALDPELIENFPEEVKAFLKDDYEGDILKKENEGVYSAGFIFGLLRKMESLINLDDDSDPDMAYYLAFWEKMEEEVANQENNIAYEFASKKLRTMLGCPDDVKIAEFIRENIYKERVTLLKKNNNGRIEVDKVIIRTKEDLDRSRSAAKNRREQEGILKMVELLVDIPGTNKRVHLLDSASTRVFDNEGVVLSQGILMLLGEGENLDFPKEVFTEAQKRGIEYAYNQLGINPDDPDALVMAAERIKLINIKIDKRLYKINQELWSARSLQEFGEILKERLSELEVQDVFIEINKQSEIIKRLGGLGQFNQIFENAGLSNLIEVVSDKDDKERVRNRIKKIFNGSAAQLDLSKDVSVHLTSKNMEKYPSEKIGEYDGLAEFIKNTFRQMLTIIKIEDLTEQATIDKLTQVFNRRTLDRHLGEQIEKINHSGEDRESDREKESSLTVFMLDVDHFKNFNDIYGHDAGDAVLSQLGKTLKEQVSRLGDFVARYGGEEFTVVLRDTDEKDAGNIAERLRKAVEEMKVVHQGTTLKVTASFGMARAIKESRDTPETLIKKADRMLYIAKEQGRNRVVSESTLEGCPN